MQTKLLLLTGVLAATAALAQPKEANTNSPHFGVNLKYNSAESRYEVYARPNFNGNRFPLGPSQLSVVVPNTIADQPLAVYSETAVRWADYSDVYAPKVAPDVDIHGIHSMGRLIDFQKDTPFLLFTFSLPGGYVDGVRLFVNGKDPNSAQAGMRGGDFSNTLSDSRSVNYFRSVFDQAELANLSKAPLETVAPSISVYPNPITGDSFLVTARQFSAGERVRLRVISSSGVELSALEESSTALSNYRISVPRQATGQLYLYTERLEQPETAPGPAKFCQKLIVVP
jgi:hypothetical protein